MAPGRPDQGVVLIVDDVPDTLAVLSDALDGAGYMVLVATDGASAIARLDHVVPDIVLLDAVMPGLNGFETCRRIKQHPAGGQVPVIFMTGLTETEDVVKGFQAGGVDYVTKPIHPDEVLARIVSHLRTARMLRHAQAALDAAGLAVVITEDDGSCSLLSAKARRILQRHFPAFSGAEPDLPAPIGQWAVRRRSASGTENSLVVADSRLAVHFLGAVSAGRDLLLIEEHDATAGNSSRLMRSYRLTPREAEVLTWVACGKTNRDIGAILGMSPRTVNKHLEHIYVKLGVETRTAAAALTITRLPEGAG